MRTRVERCGQCGLVTQETEVCVCRASLATERTELTELTLYVKLFIYQYVSHRQQTSDVIAFKYIKMSLWQQLIADFYDKITGIHSLIAKLETKAMMRHSDPLTDVFSADFIEHTEQRGQKTSSSWHSYKYRI